ncbi:MAG: hypothetical protein D6748_08875 [Calditrichaeota bacterium]|nr:MAG: hypothetical protein D6748_08875 [Calditrichota bacterium]
MTYLKNPDHPELPLCKHMRTKASYVPDLKNEHYMKIFHPYSPCFCLKTLRSIGPDDDVVCAAECTPERMCFEPLFTHLLTEQGSQEKKDSSDA